MDTFLIILAVTLGILGIIGSVAPVLPGPPLGWIALLLTYFAKGTNGAGEPMTTKFLLVWLGITTLVTVLDYIVPAWFTKVTGGTKYAGWGAMAGLFLGLIYPPLGMVLGSLLGAFLFDFFLGDKGVWESFKSSIGAFLGFIFGTGLKLTASGIMLYYVIVYI